MPRDFWEILGFFLFPFLVLLVSIMFSAFALYSSFSFLDSVVHVVGGLSISYTALLFFHYCRTKDVVKIKNEFMLIFLVVSVVGFVAICWEFLEFLLKTFFGLPFQPSLDDTLLDILMGLIGGLFGAVVFRKV